LYILGAAALAASALASPAMAQQVISDPGYCSQFYPNANCQNRGPGSSQRHANYRGGVNARAAPAATNNTWGWNDGRYRSGFFPGDVAAGVVGGAIGTVGAIATAPFRAANAYDNRYYGDNYYGYGYGRRDWKTYGQRNALACTPGTTFRGGDGKRHLCQ
jgi:hypothetical protein